jgi:CheY-like chemotaxis protein
MSKKKFFAVVVDDDEGIKTALQELLREEGFLVKSFPNGKEAKEYLDSLPGYVLPPNVILTDMEMPIMGGEELLKFIKKKYSEKRRPPLMVAMSGNGSKYTAAINAGADIFLHKPFFGVAEKIKKILELES